MFNYFSPNTGSVQSFTAPQEGIYKLEVWGAQGSSGWSGGISANGGYSYGNIHLIGGTVLYIYTGGSVVYNVFNGGGGYSSGCADFNNSTGGGATDIRLASGEWNNFNSLKSRIMVAAGAGGNIGPLTKPGYGGGLVSVTANGAYPGYDDDYGEVSGVSQTSGFSFGIGQTGNSGSTGHDRSGGGGGYYGGYAYRCAASGGSSFISGYPGCNAIKESSTESNIVHSDSPNHYSGYVFINSVMIAGSASMPSPVGGTESGHGGNGSCIISYIP